jgi:dephospho-CoA kinase
LERILSVRKETACRTEQRILNPAGKKELCYHPAMLRVGLTGNIASGKSHATQVFAELGAHIIDADVIAHVLLTPGTSAYDGVVAAFGGQILNPDATINRRKLGEIIFQDEAKRAELNSLVHPEVRAEVLRRIGELEDSAQNGIIIIDAALMVESGFFRTFDRLIVVHCSPSLQLSRIVSRDGVTLAQARARMSAQMPVEEKIKHAHYTIETSGTFRQTRDQIESIYRDLLLLNLKKKNSG